YLVLKIGLTVSASIPAAVISMAILRGLFRRKSILENNIVQTMTTAGEAVAAGAIFTLPALYLWDLSPSQAMIAFIVVT
ncbi:OPT/YSL family transporter, partial [Shewanella sp. C31]|nr:OPT/YSL family transporter [Shewanella electrica]